MNQLLKSYIFRSGALLAFSAGISKFLGLLRDRLFVQFFADNGQIDLIFAAFRIPDFFFFLLISGTIATLFIPRVSDIKTDHEQTQFFSSFLWGVVILFGGFSILACLAAPLLVKLFAAGLDGDAQIEVAKLARYLFGSVFLLALSSVFSAALQQREKFFSIALAPIIYTGSICLGVYYLAPEHGLKAVGISAIGGALLHLMTNISGLWYQRRTLAIPFHWKQPPTAFQNFWSDFWYRVGNGAAFQINQTIDVLIASFLMVGSIAAFSMGTNLGHFLLTIVGFSVANVLFPKFSKNKDNKPEQKRLLKKGIGWVLALTIPAVIIAVLLSKWLLTFFLNLSGETLRLTNIVFLWTVLSLPAACLIPLFSRVFLANDDAKTPVKLTAISLGIATTLAAILSLKVFPSETAIMGLAIGNFVANYLSAGLFSFGLWKKTFSLEK